MTRGSILIHNFALFNAKKSAHHLSVSLSHPSSCFPVVRIIHRSSLTILSAFTIVPCLCMSPPPQCWVVYRILKASNTVMSLQSPLSREWGLSRMLNGPQHSCCRSPPPGPVRCTTCARRVWKWKQTQWNETEWMRTCVLVGGELNRVTKGLAPVSHVNEDEWGVLGLQLCCI